MSGEALVIAGSVAALLALAGLAVLARMYGPALLRRYRARREYARRERARREAIDRFNASVTELNAAMIGLSAAMVEHALPAVQALGQAIEDVTREGNKPRDPRDRVDFLRRH